MPRRVAAVNATVIAIKGGHTKYKHCKDFIIQIKVYTRNQYFLLNSSAIIFVYYIKSLASFIPMHDFWPPKYSKLASKIDISIASTRLKLMILTRVGSALWVVKFSFSLNILKQIWQKNVSYALKGTA